MESMVSGEHPVMESMVSGLAWRAWSQECLAIQKEVIAVSAGLPLRVELSKLLEKLMSKVISKKFSRLRALAHRRARGPERAYDTCRRRAHSRHQVVIGARRHIRFFIFTGASLNHPGAAVPSGRPAGSAPMAWNRRTSRAEVMEGRRHGELAGKVHLMGSGNARRLMSWTVDGNATKEMHYLMFESVSTGNITYRAISSFEPIARLPAPRQIDLRAQVDGHYPTRPLSILLNHDLFPKSGYYVNHELQYQNDYAGLSFATGMNSKPLINFSGVVANKALAVGGDVAYDSESGDFPKYNAGLSLNKGNISAAMMLFNSEGKSTCGDLA